MNRIRLKFAWLPTKVEGRWIWLKQYWVREQLFAVGLTPIMREDILEWLEVSRALGVDTL